MKGITVSYPNIPYIPAALYAPLRNEFMVYFIENKTNDAIFALEYFFSPAFVMQDAYLRSRMTASLWSPLEELLQTWAMASLGVSTIVQVRFLANHAIGTNPLTNIELDSTETLIRPRWAKWSQINFKLSFPAPLGRTLRKKEKIAMGKTILQEALASVKFSQQVAHEPSYVRVAMFGQEPDGWFTAAFNVPGFPSLIQAFMNQYAENGVSVEVIECFDSPLSFPPYAHRSPALQ